MRHDEPYEDGFDDPRPWIQTGGPLPDSAIGDAEFVAAIWDQLTDIDVALGVIEDPDNYRQGLQRLGIPEQEVMSLVVSEIQKRWRAMEDTHGGSALIDHLVAFCLELLGKPRNRWSAEAPFLKAKGVLAVIRGVAHQDMDELSRSVNRGSILGFYLSSPSAGRLRPIEYELIREAVMDVAGGALSLHMQLALALMLAKGEIDDFDWDDVLDAAGLAESDLEGFRRTLASGEADGAAIAFAPADLSALLGNKIVAQSISSLGFELDPVSFELVQVARAKSTDLALDPWCRLSARKILAGGPAGQKLQMLFKGRLGSDADPDVGGDEAWRREEHFDFWFGDDECTELVLDTVKDELAPLLAGSDLCACFAAGVLLAMGAEGRTHTAALAAEIGLTEEDLEQLRLVYRSGGRDQVSVAYDEIPRPVLGQVLYRGKEYFADRLGDVLDGRTEWMSDGLTAQAQLELTRDVEPGQQWIVPLLLRRMEQGAYDLGEYGDESLSRLMVSLVDQMSEGEPLPADLTQDCGNLLKLAHAAHHEGLVSPLPELLEEMSRSWIESLHSQDSTESDLFGGMLETAVRQVQKHSEPADLTKLGRACLDADVRVFIDEMKGRCEQMGNIVFPAPRPPLLRRAMCPVFQGIVVAVSLGWFAHAYVRPAQDEPDLPAVPRAVGGQEDRQLVDRTQHHRRSVPAQLLGAPARLRRQR